MKIRPLHEILIGAIAAALFLFLSCGLEDKERSATNSMEAVSVGVHNELNDLHDTAGMHGFTNHELQGLAQQIIAERLRALGLVPSMLPEFFNFNLEIHSLEGCGNSYWNVCPGRFSFALTLTASAGPDLLDTVTRRASFSSLDFMEVRRRLDWTINLLLETMLQHGTLGELGLAGAESPYFGTGLETPYY